MKTFTLNRPSLEVMILEENGSKNGFFAELLIQSNDDYFVVLVEAEAELCHEIESSWIFNGGDDCEIEEDVFYADFSVNQMVSALVDEDANETACILSKDDVESLLNEQLSDVFAEEMAKDLWEI